jgi:hypothetical protein
LKSRFSTNYNLNDPREEQRGFQEGEYSLHGHGGDYEEVLTEKLGEP